MDVVVLNLKITGAPRKGSRDSKWVVLVDSNGPIERLKP